MPPNEQPPVHGAECSAALAELHDWVTADEGGHLVGLAVAAAEAAPQDGEGHAVVVLLPLRVAPSRGGGPSGRVVTSAEVTMRVLLTSRGGTTTERACLVTELALRLIAAGRWTLDADGPPPELWPSLGLTPRPGLLLELKVRRLLDRAPAPPVRHPIRLGSMPIRELTGRVIAPDGTPISAAVVAVLPDGPRATTDHRGRFALSVAVPETGLQARVRARGLDLVLAMEISGDRGVGDLILTGLPT